MSTNAPNKILTHFNYTLLLYVIPLIALGLMLIAELDTSLLAKQIVNILISILAAFIVFFIPYRKFHLPISVFYVFSILLLILVEFIGSEKLGAKRWIEIPFSSFSIQPSEIIKISLVLMLASFIFRNPPPKDGYKLKEFAMLSSLIMIPFILVAIQPDLGTAMLIFLSGFGVLFLIGVNRKIWISIALICAIAIPVAYNTPILKDYQKKRISDFLSTQSPYQVTQSLVAIGSGGLIGKSVENATQSQLNFLPYASTDFMFAYIMERFGFIGGFLLCLVYFTLTIHILKYAFKPTSDFFLKTIAGYIAMLLFLYTTINILMVIGLAPVVGIPLPLLSYGGTSFLTFMVLFGIFENLLAFKFIFEYNSPFKSFNKIFS